MTPRPTASGLTTPANKSTQRLQSGRDGCIVRVVSSRTIYYCLVSFGVMAVVGSPVRTASAQAERFCDKPDNAGAFLAVSPGVTCATAQRVKQKLIGACYTRSRCVAKGFRCVAYWDGRFDRPFEFTHHALCVNGWRWILWDGG